MDALPHPHFTTIETSSRPPLAPIVRGAFEAALVQRSKVNEAVFAIAGYTSRRIQMFFNNLIGAVPDPRYLEIGMFCGASFCAAIDQNKVTATGIDNWSGFGGMAGQFYGNLSKFCGDGQIVSILERDFRTVDYKALGPFNVLFYDGSHEEKDQYDGIRIPEVALDDHAVVIVDDWNWDRVRRGTLAALSDAGRHIEYSIEVRTTLDGQGSTIPAAESEWHNGLFVAIVSRG